jgi:hypothetical protein
MAERAERLRGVSGNAFELCPERLFRVPHVKGLLHPDDDGDDDEDDEGAPCELSVSWRP